jgi:hypothetical protein
MPESSRRQEKIEASQRQEEPRTADATEFKDDNVLEEIEGHPKDGD